MKKVIRLSSGAELTVDRIENYIDNEGREYALAFKGKKVYEVVDRDSLGAIWAEKK